MVCQYKVREINGDACENIEPHIQHTTHVQECRVSVHKRVTHNVATLALPFIADDSIAPVNHARGLQHVQPPELSQFFLLLLQNSTLSVVKLIHTQHNFF